MPFEVHLVNLDPTIRSEIKKTRPAVVISPDEANRTLNTVIIAPMTTTRRYYPTRIDCHFQGKEGQVALDQLRSVDKSRLIKPLGKLDDEETQQLICDTLGTMFSFY